MMAWFFGHTRVGRAITMIVHRWPLHPGKHHPLRFQSSGGCLLCRLVTSEILDRGHRDALDDQSSIVLTEPSPGYRGINMTATAKRQLDEIMAKDPSAAAKIQEAIKEIARDPGE